MLERVLVRLRAPRRRAERGDSVEEHRKRDAVRVQVARSGCQKEAWKFSGNLHPSRPHAARASCQIAPCRERACRARGVRVAPIARCNQTVCSCADLRVANAIDKSLHRKSASSLRLVAAARHRSRSVARRTTCRVQPTLPLPAPTDGAPRCRAPNLERKISAQSTVSMHASARVVSASAARLFRRRSWSTSAPATTGACCGGCGAARLAHLVNFTADVRDGLRDDGRFYRAARALPGAAATTDGMLHSMAAMRGRDPTRVHRRGPTMATRSTPPRRRVPRSTSTTSSRALGADRDTVARDVARYHHADPALVPSRLRADAHARIAHSEPSVVCANRLEDPLRARRLAAHARRDAAAAPQRREFSWVHGRACQPPSSCGVCCCRVHRSSTCYFQTLAAACAAAPAFGAVLIVGWDHAGVSPPAEASRIHAGR